MIAEVFNLYATRWDFFAQLILQHLQLSFIAIGLAALIGIFFGIVISEHGKLAFPVLGVTNLIYTIPSIAMLGFLVPATGIGDTTAVIALTVYGLLPMVRNTHTGIKGISPAIIEAGKGMGSTESQLLFKIKLPLAMPVILAGARNMIVMTIALCGICLLYTSVPLVRNCVEGKKLAVTFENHSIYGGLGSAVAEVMAECAQAVPLRRIGVQDRFGQVGPVEYLKETFGLTAKHLEREIEQALRQR